MLVMPYPRRIDAETVLDAARNILEEHGPDGLTMRALARELSVRAPSLYAYVESRDDLLRELVIAGLRELGERLAAASTATGPAERIIHIAEAYIAFAESGPQLFTLMFGNQPRERRAPAALERKAASPVIEVAEALVGREGANTFAQAIWSFVHGYVVLHLAGRFELNADPRRAFFDGLDLLVRNAVATRPLDR
jgi:AcrR family transcriptional regulator